MQADTTKDKMRIAELIEPGNDLELRLKKVVFGGYDCKEVEEYISILKKNMQLAEKSYSEKLEECLASCEMYLSERDKFMQIIKDTEKRANKYKSDAIEACEKNKFYMIHINREKEELKEIVKSLKEQIENNQQVNNLSEKIEQLGHDNKELKSMVKLLQQQISKTI